MHLAHLIYRVLYRVGFTPWDGHPIPRKLVELAEGVGALPKGRALDIGCGTGDSSIFLAKRGWDVTGIDFVPRAVERARTKVQAEGVSVRLVAGDVTRLGSSGVVGPFSLFVDNGCFHGLDDTAREAYVREVSRVATPRARLVLTAFLPGRRGPGPRGVAASEVEQRFAATGWRLLANGPDSNAPPGDARWSGICFYDLERSAVD